MSELTATYRLQMNAGFTFAQARERIDYFARLGVSHLYLSPIFAARKGSMHGYDVVDPSRINPALGSEGDLRALASALRQRDMGLVLDIVPNHMGIGAENTRWDDVLKHGETSRHARWFDIDWSPRGGVAGKVVLPVLGDTLDAVLERGELSVRVHEGEEPRVWYFQQSFPLDPASLPPELQLATVDPEETGELTELFSGIEGRDRLRSLLDQQHYRLVYWKRGPDEINYRRFFDVNDLAAVRVEDQSVFDESHALILRLAQEGVVAALRIDHIDGLRDPLAYLKRLREALPAMPLFVEKILSSGEELRTEWPIDGTTGYEFLDDLEDVFIDPAGFAHIEAAYRSMRRLDPTTTFHTIARDGKIACLRGALRVDVARLATLVAPIARASGRKWRPVDLEPALVEVIASLPVYRTYLDGHSRIGDADRELIDRARTEAMRLAPALAERAQFICDLLLDAVEGADPARRLDFVGRFQQVSGPATAKGVEDTALYVYVPLASRDEVGGSPDRPLDQAVQRFHAGNGERASRWPRALVATNTHDTKRSADVRGRLDALSEMAHEWERSLRRWRRLNSRHRATVKGRLSPDTNTEYLIYQTLVALWPPPRPGRRVDDLPDRQWRDTARERMVRYAVKAAREAKTSTNWVEPAPEYENALNAFVAAILEPSDDAPFLTDVARLVAHLAPIGAANCLSRIVLHLTSPGTADVYQGDELWNFTLVDPDNRRQVDYDVRARLLGEVEHLTTLPDRYDSRLKLLVMSRLLTARRERPDLFMRGDYMPLVATGPRAQHVVAFARSFEQQRLITIATRLACDRIGSDPNVWWAGTTIELPEAWRERGSRSLISNETLAPAGSISVGELLRTIPVAVLVN